MEKTRTKPLALPDGSIQARETFVQGEMPIQEKMTTYSDGMLATWTIEQEGHEKTEFTYLKDPLGRLGTLQLKSKKYENLLNLYNFLNF